MINQLKDKIISVSKYWCIINFILMIHNVFYNSWIRFGKNSQIDYIKILIIFFGVLFFAFSPYIVLQFFKKTDYISQGFSEIDIKILFILFTLLMPCFTLICVCLYTGYNW